MKFCKFCGKELDDEANFCPYCMKKQTECESTPLPPKRGAKPQIIIIAAAAVLIAALSVFLILRHGKKAADVPALSQTVSEVSEQSTSADSDEVSLAPQKDYSSYEGTWEAYNSGSTVLDIESANESNVVFSLVKNSAGEYRFARIEHISAEIKDGVAAFKFTDDGWGNGGTGKLIFDDESITVQTEISVVTDAWYQWDISMEPTKLSRRNLNSIALETANYLGRSYEDVKKDFGMSVSEEQYYNEAGAFYQTDLEFSGGITLTLVEGNILSITEDYSKTENKSKCNYKGVDGNSTYDDVVKKLGTPLDSYNETDGTNNLVLGYGVTNGYMKITISASDGKVEQIWQFIPYL